MPEISGITRFTEQTVSAQVRGAEPIHPSYYKRAFIPGRIRVEYNRDENRPWLASHITVSGSIQKKDGTAGQVGMNESYYRLADAPEWVRNFVAANMPGNAVGEGQPEGEGS